MSVAWDRDRPDDLQLLIHDPQRALHRHRFQPAHARVEGRVEEVQ
jgi:hypothetical protein